MAAVTAHPIVRAALLFVVFALGLTAARAETPAPVVVAPLKHDLTATDVEAFLDGLVPLQIETNDIAGATIAVVKDGEVIFVKGYGFADLKARTPVTPETMFRIGSITKMFTWTSVMQLVEQGKLDLDADVNTYLDFKVPHTFGKPVTLRNLMTHRGGFQEVIKGLGAQNTGIIDLKTYVREVPDQIFEPGTVPAYSNYGTALAGYIVERVSGAPFDTYLEEHIYAPLNMLRTSIRQPLEKELEAYMSTGYRLGSGEPVPYEIVNGYPAGSQSSSATDMAKFMLMHLNGGKLDDAQILKRDTAVMMQDTVTKVDPRQNGIALGFYELSRNGMRIISHGGDTIAFHSDMHLIPAENLGFFVSYNSTGRGDTAPRGQLWRKFLDRYYPYTPPAANGGTATGLTAAEVVGSYQTTRRSDTSLLRAFTELAQATVSEREDGTIEASVIIGPNGQPRRFEPIGDGVFREVHGQDRLVFVRDKTGRIIMAPWSAGVAVYQRVEPSQSSLFYLALLGIPSLILIANLVLWPVASLIRWRYYTGLEWRTPAHLLRAGTMAASAALLTMIFGIASVFVPRLDDPWTLDSTLDGSLRLFQLIGIIGAIATIIPIVNAAQSWTNPLRGFVGRLKETAVALSCLALIWFAWTMNLFDQSLRF
jgi:CubicO group peptidase (beta-lactamase class C family)